MPHNRRLYFTVSVIYLLQIVRLSHSRRIGSSRGETKMLEYFAAVLYALHISVLYLWPTINEPIYSTPSNQRFLH